jgi:flagella basal body P-ring formation protein FlgA
MRYALAMLLALAAAGPASGAEVTLRRQAKLTGSVVRLGDVADLSAAEATVIDELAAVPLCPAPAPGRPQYLGAAQLRDLLAASGVDVSHLRMRGADAVAISVAPIESADSDGPQAPATRPSREAVSSHAAAAITQYLREQTGHDLWNVTVDADSDLVDAYWKQGANLTVSGGKAPWIGRQRFAVTGTGPSRQTPAYATVERLEMIAFATRTIAKGDFLRAADVALRPHTGSVPALAFRSLDAIIGKEAVQAIRPEAMLLASHVRAPLLVRRGELVQVRARATGVLITTYATAQQDGSLGDLVQVQSLEGKERFVARVSGPQELEIFAAGASASDIVSASR